MNKLLIIISLAFILLPSILIAETKKISCELTKKDESAPWRYDEWIFSTDDFEKDTPKATHKLTLASDEVIRPDKSVNYSVTPTHIIFEEVFITFPNEYHSISRKTLDRTITYPGTSKCSIADVEEQENIF